MWGFGKSGHIYFIASTSYAHMCVYIATYMYYVYVCVYILIVCMYTHLNVVVFRE